MNKFIKKVFVLNKWRTKFADLFNIITTIFELKTKQNRKIPRIRYTDAATYSLTINFLPGFFALIHFLNEPAAPTSQLAEVQAAGDVCKLPRGAAVLVYIYNISKARAKSRDKTTNPQRYEATRRPSTTDKFCRSAETPGF